MRKTETRKEMQKKYMSLFMIFLVLSLSFDSAYALSVSFNPAKDVSVSQTSAQVNWTTDSNANSVLSYGETKNYGIDVPSPLGKTNNVALTNLTPSTNYFYKIFTSTANETALLDNSGNSYSFKTTADMTAMFLNVTIPDTVNTISLTVSGITKPYALVHAYIDPLPGQIGPTFYDKETIADINGFFIISGLLLTDNAKQTIAFWAKDTSGGTTLFQKNIFVDTKPPIVSYSFNRSVSGLLVNGSIDESSTVEIYVTEENTSVQAPQKIILNATTFSEQVPLKEGKNTVRLVVRDLGNNTFETEQVFSFFSSPPAFIYPQSLESVYSPASTQDLTIHGQINRPGKVQAFVNGKDAGTVATDYNGSFSIDVTLEKIFNLTISSQQTSAGIPSTVVTGSTQQTQGNPPTPYLPGNVPVWDNTVKLIATDETGMQTVLEGKIKYQLCGVSGPFSIIIEKPTPDVLVPKLLLDGTQEQGFNFKLNFSAQGPYTISNVNVKPREISPEERKRFDMEYAQIIPSVAAWKQDSHTGYVLLRMHVSDPTPSGENWTSYKKEASVSDHRKTDKAPTSLLQNDCKIPGLGCIRVPLQIEISYTSQVQSGVQSQCWEVESSIEPNLFNPDVIPKGFLKGTVSALNTTIKGIDTILDPLKKIQTYIFYGCAISWAAKFILSVKEKWNCDFSSALAGKNVRVPAEQGKCGDDSICQSCSDSIDTRKKVDKGSQWICDRIFCPSAPSLQKFIKDANARNPKAKSMTDDAKLAGVKSDCELAEVTDVISYWEKYSDGIDKKYCSKPHVYDQKCCVQEYMDKWDSACAFMDEARESACLSNQNNVAQNAKIESGAKTNSKLNCYPAFNAVAGLCEKNKVQQAELINAGKSFVSPQKDMFGKGKYAPQKKDYCKDWYTCETKGYGASGNCPVETPDDYVVDLNKANDNYGCRCSDGKTGSSSTNSEKDLNVTPNPKTDDSKLADLQKAIASVKNAKAQLDLATEEEKEISSDGKKQNVSLQKAVQQDRIDAAQTIAEAYSIVSTSATNAGKTEMSKIFLDASTAMIKVTDARNGYMNSIGTKNEKTKIAELKIVRKPAKILIDETVKQITLFENPSQEKSPPKKDSSSCLLSPIQSVDDAALGSAIFFRVLPAIEGSDLTESTVQIGYVEPSAKLTSAPIKLKSDILSPSDVGEAQKFIPKQDITNTLQTEDPSKEFTDVLKSEGGQFNIEDSRSLYKKIRSSMGFITKDYIVDPTSGILRSVQCACLPAVTSWLSWWRSALFAVKSCLETIMITGDGKTGVCKEVLSVYVCDLTYDLISCFSKKYSAGSGTDSRGGIGSILGALTGAGAQVENSVAERYGTSNTFQALFADRALVHSVCLFAFTGEWIFDVGGIFNQQFPIPINSMGLIEPATRRYVSSNMAAQTAGQATFNYDIGVALLAGADLDYKLTLYCSKDYTCDPAEGFAGGKCDCVEPSLQGASERVIQIQGQNTHLAAGEMIGEKGQGAVFTENIQAPVRYDKIKLEWKYKNKDGQYVSDSVERKVKQIGGNPPAYCELHIPLGYSCNADYGTYDAIQFVGDPIPSENIYFPGQKIQLTYTLENLFPESAESICAGKATCDYTKYLKVVITNDQGKTLYPLNTQASEESFIPINSRGKVTLVVPYGMNQISLDDFNPTIGASQNKPQLVKTGTGSDGTVLNPHLGDITGNGQQAAYFVLQFNDIGTGYKICPVLNPQDLKTVSGKLAYSTGSGNTPFNCENKIEGTLVGNSVIQYGGITIPVISEAKDNANAIFIISYAPVQAQGTSSSVCNEQEHQWTVTATLHRGEQKSQFTNLFAPNPEAIATKQSFIRAKCAGGGTPGLSSLVGKTYFTLMDLREGEVKSFEKEPNVLYTFTTKGITDSSVSLSVTDANGKTLCDTTITYDANDKTKIANVVNCDTIWLGVNAIILGTQTPYSTQLNKASMIIFSVDPSTIPKGSFEQLGYTLSNNAIGQVSSGSYQTPSLQCTGNDKPSAKLIVNLETKKDSSSEKKIKEIIIDAARKYKIHPALLAARAQAESSVDDEQNNGFMGCISEAKDYTTQVNCAAKLYTLILSGKYASECKKYVNDPAKLFLCGNCKYVGPGHCTKDCTTSEYYKDKITSCSIKNNNCYWTDKEGKEHPNGEAGQCMLSNGAFEDNWVGYPSRVKKLYCDWSNYVWGSEFSNTGSVANSASGGNVGGAYCPGDGSLILNDQKIALDGVDDTHLGKVASCGNRDTNRILFIVLHEGGASLASTIATFKSREVSSHFYIDQTGKISQLVDIRRVAHHAGYKTWGTVNTYSIGIDLEESSNCINGNTCSYTDSQVAALKKLVQYLTEHTGIKLDDDHVIAHCQVPPPSGRSDPRGLKWESVADTLHTEKHRINGKLSGACVVNRDDGISVHDYVNNEVQKLGKPSSDTSENYEIPEGDNEDTVNIGDTPTVSDLGIKSQEDCSVSPDSATSNCICGYYKTPPENSKVWTYSTFLCKKNNQNGLSQLYHSVEKETPPCRLGELNALEDSGCTCGNYQAPIYASPQWDTNTIACVQNDNGFKLFLTEKKFVDCPKNKKLTLSKNEGCKCGNYYLSKISSRADDGVQCTDNNLFENYCPINAWLLNADKDFSCICGKNHAPKMNAQEWNKHFIYCDGTTLHYQAICPGGLPLLVEDTGCLCGDNVFTGTSSGTAINTYCTKIGNTYELKQGA